MWWKKIENLEKRNQYTANALTDPQGQTVNSKKMSVRSHGNCLAGLSFYHHHSLHWQRVCLFRLYFGLCFWTAENCQGRAVRSSLSCTWGSIPAHSQDGYPHHTLTSSLIFTRSLETLSSQEITVRLVLFCVHGHHWGHNNRRHFLFDVIKC